MASPKEFTNGFRTMPAEWDSRFSATLIAWPHAGTDWAETLREADKCYVGLAEALVQAGQWLLIVTPEPERVWGLISHLPNGRIKVVESPTNDTWTRDYGPLAVGILPQEGGEPREPREAAPLVAVNYQFNGWGLKFAADKDNMVFPRLNHSSVMDTPADFRKGYVLEGGSIESDGRGTILTTSECMLSPNRNGIINREDVERELALGLGAERVLWLDHGALAGDDTDSHIDTLARFAPDDTILYVKSYDPEDTHTKTLDLMEEQLKELRTAEGNPYNLIGLPLPSPIYDDSGNRLPATYANFLITPRAVLMPTYNQPRKDEMAAQMLRIAFPNHEILTVDCRTLIIQHGSLHCTTMQFPAEWLQ